MRQTRYIPNLYKSLACLLFMLALSSNAALAQQQGQRSSTNVRRAEYPMITPDNRIIFRLKAPDAGKIQVRIGKGYEMEQGQDGFWTATTDPMSPGFHIYSFVIDGIAVSGPGSETFFTTGRWISGIEIPEAGVDFYDVKDVPHGDVRRVRYLSKESNDWRRLFIYTPPCYGTNTSHQYPVLYIQHGAGENETSWGIQGKLDIIIDNLIAEGKAVPMIAVMSDDYLADNIGGGYNSQTTNAFFDMFGRDLVHSIIPFVEKHYRAIPDRRSRAITGLSMGGGISFRIGLHNLDTFANVGVFSTSAFRGRDNNIFDIEAQVPGLLSNPASFNEKLDVFYISNGEQDGSYNYTLKTVETLREHGIKVELKTFPGAHEWHVWRKALNDFAPRLFKQ